MPVSQEQGYGLAGARRDGAGAGKAGGYVVKASRLTMPLGAV